MRVLYYGVSYRDKELLETEELSSMSYLFFNQCINYY